MPITMVWLTWLLLAGLVIFEIRNAFSEFSRHRTAWKLAAHCVLLTALGMFIVQMGLFVLMMPIISQEIALKIGGLATPPPATVMNKQAKAHKVAKPQPKKT